MYSKTPGFWKSQRMLTIFCYSKTSSNTSVCVQVMLLFSFYLWYCIIAYESFHYFTFLPKDEVVSVWRLLLLFFQTTDSVCVHPSKWYWNCCLRKQSAISLLVEVTQFRHKFLCALNNYWKISLSFTPRIFQQR